MELKVKYRGQEKILNFDKDKVKAKDILKALGLSKDFAFVVKNGEIVDENETITQNDEVRVINAISGGKNSWENVLNAIKKPKFTFHNTDSLYVKTTT